MYEIPNSVLPGDHVNDILLCLPVKSICRFKCVSKPWRSLLSCDQFMRAHSKLHAGDPEELIVAPCVGYDKALNILTLAAGAGASFARKVHLPYELEYPPVVEGSCDGLVMLKYTSPCKKILFNPLTLEVAEVFDDRDTCTDYQRSYGFGYDSWSDDYKIVCLTERDGVVGSFVDVYSVRMKCWKRIGDSFYALNDIDPGVYLNGCIHWSGLDTGNGFVSLVCFDLAREEFKEGLFHGSFEFDITVFKGCLALMSEPPGLYNDPKTFDVWVMREYGVRDSWTKFATIAWPLHSDRWPYYYSYVCFLNEDEIVVERNYTELLAYSRRDGIWRDLVIDGIPLYFSRVMPFRGSLLSPKLG